MKCPNSETLAAFMDGKLQGADRETVVAHLADCDACREVFAGAVEFQEEVTSGGTVTLLPRARRRWPLAVAATVVIAALSSIFAAQFPFGLGAPDDLSSLELLRRARPGDTSSRLPAGWTDHRWPVTRGTSTSRSERVRAFRLGVLLVDLQASLPDAANSRPIIRDLVLEFDSAAAFAPLAATYDALLDEQDMQRLTSRAADLERRALTLVSSDYLDLGRFLESARVGRLLGNDATIDLPSSFSDLAMPSEARAMLTAVRQASDDGPTQAALLADLIRTLGGR